MKTIQKYYDNGQLKERYTLSDKEEIEGLYEKWYTNGQLYMKANYKDGKVQGLAETWHENGQLKVKDTYKDGERHGLCEEFYSNGQLFTKCNYKNSQINGLFQSWYKNGQLKRTTHFDNENRYGISVWYYPNGDIREKQYYIDDQEVTQQEWEQHQLQITNHQLLPMNTLKKLYTKVKATRDKLEKRLFHPSLFTPKRVQIIETTMLIIMILLMLTGLAIAITKLIEINYEL